MFYFDEIYAEEYESREEEFAEENGTVVETIDEHYARQAKRKAREHLREAVMYYMLAAQKLPRGFFSDAAENESFGILQSYISKEIESIDLDAIADRVLEKLNSRS